MIMWVTYLMGVGSNPLRYFKRHKLARIVPIAQSVEESKVPEVVQGGDSRTLAELIPLRSLRAPESPMMTQSMLESLLLESSRELFDQFGGNRSKPDPRSFRNGFEHVSPRLSFERNAVHFGLAPIGTSFTSHVFVIKSSPEWVIKYSTYCRSEQAELDPIDPILVESWFLEQLNVLEPGLAPKFLYYSAGIQTSIAGDVTACYPQTSSDDALPIFSSLSKYPTVRYLITERMGKSLWYYWRTIRSGDLDLFTAIRLGGQLLELLERLHSHNMIHGDIHMGNVMIKDSRLVLIDFGRSKLIDPEEMEMRSSQKNFNDQFWFHPILSMWETQWYRPSFRDDVFRAVQIIASLIFGPRYWDCLDWMAESRADVILREFLDFKFHGNVFSTEFLCPGGQSNLVNKTVFDVDKFNFGAVITKAVKDSLNTINALIHHSVSISSKANFNALHDQLAQILLFDSRDQFPTTVYIYDVPDLARGGSL
jgi:hypothetical protein